MMSMPFVSQTPQKKELLKNPVLLTFFTIILWSFGSLLARLIAIQSQFVLLAFSFFFSFIVLVIYTLTGKRSSKKFGMKIPVVYILIGPLGYFLYSVAITQSSRAFDSISETTIINNTWPIFTVIFSDLFFQKVNKSNAVRWIEGFGILLGLLSILILATNGDFLSIQIDPIGLVWGLIAGIAYGVFGAYSGTLKEEDQKTFLLVSIILSLLLISIPAALEWGTIKPITITDIIVAFALGAIMDGVGYILWVRAIRLSHENNRGISSIASFMLFLPFINLVIVKLFLRENQLMNPLFIVSLALLLLSTYIVQRSKEISFFFQKQ